MKPHNYLPLLLIVGAGLGWAQDLQIQSAIYAGGVVQTGGLTSQHIAIRVQFSQAVSASGPHLDTNNIRLVNAPAVQVMQPMRPPLQPTVVTVPLNNTIANLQGVQICFASVTYTMAQDEQTTTGEICGAVSADIRSAKTAALERLSKIPKRSNEKDIFASGFVTMAGSESQGGADISLNPDFKIPNLTSFLNIKKTTTDEGDPKHFEGGVRYRGVLPWGRGHLNELARLAPGQALNEAITAAQGKWLAGAILDIAAKLEGEPSKFDITNFVGDAGLDLRTRTKAPFGKRGFWRGYLVPVAFEGGQNLNASAPAAEPGPATGGATNEVEWIARYKAGAGMTLYYDNPNNTVPIRRVELDMNVVMRNLFFREAMYNQETKLVDLTGKGIRAYGQVDLKFFIGESNAGRYGVKLTYNRGSLPPVFARVKSFQFGFLFESGEDEDE
jgi:hypothetical protein